ncbi:MAG: CHAT domain-containing protein [Verrucomicrobia bacterium]|nr:CHAT domain-containing protein [Verrucomicrobiota bacterium]
MKANPSANPILDLAQRALTENWSGDRLEREMQTLARSGMEGRLFQGALETAKRLPPDQPGGGRLIAMVGRLCAALQRGAADAEAAGIILLQVANLLMDRYDAESFTLAVVLLTEARSCFAPNSPGFGGTLINEANARLRLAELGVAPTEHLAQAVELYGQARGCFAPNSPGFGGTLVNEAIARGRLAELGVAPTEHLAQAVELYGQARSCFAPNSPDFGLTLMNEANARWRLAELGVAPTENLAQAVELYGQARGCFAPNSPDFGLTLMNEAIARQSLAELGVAPTEHLAQAVGLHGQARGCFAPNSSDWALCQRNHAHALSGLARFEPEPGRAMAHLRSAQGLLRDGLRVLESVRAQMPRERERIDFLETVAVQYAAMVEVCLDLAETEPNVEQAEAYRWEAWHWVHHGKSRTLLELLSRDPSRLVETDRPLREELEARARELDEAERALRLLKKNLGDEDSARRALSDPEVEARLRGLTQALEGAHIAHGAARQRLLERMESSGPLAAGPPPPPQETLAQLAALAGTEGRALLVEFFMLDREEAVAFLVPTWRRQAPRPVRFPLPQRRVAELAGSTLTAADKLIRTTRAARRGEPSSEPTAKDERLARDSFRALPDALGELLGPAFAQIGDGKEEPTELIFAPHYLLNLLPLHAATWQGRPLIERWPVSYLPSGALAAVIARRERALAGQALVVGNPTADLEGAEREAREVAAQLNRAGFEGEPFLRGQATANRLSQYGPDAAVVHAAAYSILVALDFLRSGIEMADRRFTALDTTFTQLRRALLVYLSSCDSAQMVVGRTDELMALVRAFLLAGSPSVVASLWALDDAAGCDFATHFYKHWLADGLPLARAFQQAALAVRRDRPNPFHWAPLALFGAWQTRLEEGSHES